MNRTDRLYALVEELRAVAPRSRSAPWLAQRFEVSVRTVERDLDALRETGVPIRADTGRSGGYFLDRDRTLPPVTLTAAEALAMGVALRSAADSPFGAAARRAAQKVLAVLPADVRRREEALSARLHLLGGVGAAVPPAGAVIETVLSGLANSRVLHLAYTDPGGTTTERDVEPLGLLSAPTGWYLVAWCRLRQAVRGFQIDRIDTAAELLEHTAPRDADLADELTRLGAEPFAR